MLNNLLRIRPLHPQFHADCNTNQIHITKQLDIKIYIHFSILTQASQSLIYYFRIHNIEYLQKCLALH